MLFFSFSFVVSFVYLLLTVMQGTLIFQSFGMEFRQGATRNYAHFVFYPTNDCEKGAIEQCDHILEELCAMLQREHIEFVIGAHVFNCLKQCGFPNAVCVTRKTSQNQHRVPNSAQRCNLMSSTNKEAPELCENHLHLLIYCRDDSQSSTSNAQPATTTNWRLEEAVARVRHYFSFQLPRSEMRSGFKFFQIQVWCPFSVYAAFAGQIKNKQPYALARGEQFDLFSSTYDANADLNKYFPKRAPILRSKCLFELQIKFLVK